MSLWELTSTLVWLRWVHSCAQRVHQNTLENLPSFVFLTLFNGLFFPRLTAGLAGTWVVSRIPYAIGYYSGVPRKRSFGAIFSGMSFLGKSLSLPLCLVYALLPFFSRAHPLIHPKILPARFLTRPSNVDRLADHGHVRMLYRPWRCQL